MGLHLRFPSPEAVLARDLNGLGLEEPAEIAIRNLTVAVCSGAVDLRGYADHEELVGSLLTVDGVTSGISHRIAFELGARDAMPLSEREVASALERIGAQPEGQVQRAPDAWRPWRALAAMHLLVEGAA
jgi:3-methyladenine DNA glycosylase/8-oxoguanine DNA glycosylase